MKVAELVAALERAAEEAVAYRAKSESLDDDNRAGCTAMFVATGYLKGRALARKDHEPMRARAIAALRAIGQRPSGEALPWHKRTAERCDKTAELPGLPMPGALL